MRIRKFQGRNMRESIEKMRVDLGEEAVILSSREVVENGLTYTELVAGIEPEELALHREQQNRVPTAIRHAAGEEPQQSSVRTAKFMTDAPLAQRAEYRPAIKTANSDSKSHSSVEELREQISRLTTLVTNLTDSSQHRFTEALPSAYKSVYRDLRSVCFSEQQSMALLSELSTEGFRADYAELLSAVKERIASDISTASPIRIGAERTVVLVYGPAGAGKSSVCSKLSSSFALTVNASASIVHASTVKKELEPNIPGIQTLSYDSPTQLQTALSESREAEFLFVEAHVNSQSADALATIQSLKKSVGADCVLLALPAGMHQNTMLPWLRLNAQIDNASVVLTKIDEQHLHGECLTALRQYASEVSFITDGEILPQYIKAASADRIVDVLFAQHQRTQDVATGTILENNK